MAFFSEVAADLQAFNAEMAAKLSAPIFPSLGGCPRMYFAGFDSTN
jgi:hypothetical protein